MEKRTLVSIIAALVLGTLAYAVMRAPEKGEGRQKRPRPAPTFKAAEITKLEITTQKDERTTLEKRGDRWMITSPGEWPADPAMVKGLTDGLEKLGFGDVVTSKADKHAEMGVAESGSVRVKVTTAGGATEFLLGQTMSGFTMFRLAGKDEVWQADRLFPYAANKAPKEWRDHAVLDGDAKSFEKLTVEVPAGARIELARDDKTWKLTSSTGDAPKPGEPFDASMPNTIATGLAGLRAIDFSDGKTPKDAGLEPPRLVVSVQGKGKQSLEIGGAQADDIFVRKAGEPTIYLVKKYMLDRVLYRPVDFRDKTLLNHKADEVAQLQVTQGKDVTTLVAKDGAWKLPTGATDPNKAKALVGGVESLVGSSIVTDKAAKTGLDQPRATIVVSRKDGKKATVKIGALTSDQAEYYAARDGSKDVVLVKKFAIDRVLKKPTDLAPGPPPGMPAGPGMPGAGMPHGMPPGMMPR